MKYPWDKWFAKDRFKLVRGKDFQSQVHGMLAQIRSAASSRGIKVEIITRGLAPGIISVSVVSRPKTRRVG